MIRNRILRISLRVFELLFEYWSLAKHANRQEILFFECGSERVVQRIFSKVEVPEKADQCGKDSSRLRAIQCIDPFADLIC